MGNNNEIDVSNIILLLFLFFYLLIKIFIYKNKQLIYNCSKNSWHKINWFTRLFYPVGLVSDVPIISNNGLKIDCLINDYLSKIRLLNYPITIFHPIEVVSKIKLQTLDADQAYFFRWNNLVDNKLYLELHNFAFIKDQTQVHSKPTSLPWLNATSSEPLTSQTSNTHLIHQEQKHQNLLTIKFKNHFNQEKQWN